MTTPSAVAEASALSQEATSRWAKMRKGRKFTRDTVWPEEPDIPIALRVLTFSEVQESVADAARRFRELELPLPAQDITFAEDFQDEIMTQLLWRGCRDVNDHSKPACLSVKEMRDCTTIAQRSACYKEYRDLEDEIDPDPESMSAEVIDEIRDAIKKKQLDRLKSYGSTSLASFLLSTEPQHANSLSGSSGSMGSDSKPSTTTTKPS